MIAKDILPAVALVTLTITASAAAAAKPACGTATAMKTCETGATVTIDHLIGAIENDDPAAFGSLVMHDPKLVAFGTDEAERWVGYDGLMNAVRAQLKAFKTRDITVTDRVVRVLPGGAGAYFSEIWNWTIDSEGKDMTLKNLRMTGVLVHRKGRWLLAQFHLSKPVVGQEVKYGKE